MGKAATSMTCAPERHLYNLTAAAKRLGISPSLLVRLGREHPLYRPIRHGLPGCKAGGRLALFHVAQLEAIEGAVLGADLDGAHAAWTIQQDAACRRALGHKEDTDGEA